MLQLLNSSVYEIVKETNVVFLHLKLQNFWPQYMISA